MMQADGNNYYGAHSPDDENDFERNPLLPQHAGTTLDGGADGGIGSLRSRRRQPPPPLQPPNNYLNHAGISNGDGKKYDNGSSYPNDATTPTSRFMWSENNTNGRPDLMKIKSIARIGRSTSISVDAGDFDDAATSTGYTDEYYFDDNNDYSWECSFGTEETDGIWLNKNDPPGIVMAIVVWILIGYSCMTITLLADSQHLSHAIAYLYCTICALALASHGKTMFSDPGAVPQCAVPVDSAARRNEEHAMCRACKSYKPPGSHHCRICNRCVSRMDHHCPWMNNCIGSANLKSFILFLGYTWIGSAFALIIFGCNYFFCHHESCEFPGVLVQLVRAMTVICIGSILFVSSMLANITYGVMTGIGTIDRMKRRLNNPAEQDDDPPLEFEDIFGMGGTHTITWFLPTDPVFPDYDKVLGYSMPQRLLREGNENTSVCEYVT